MSVFCVETYVVKTEKREEFSQLLNKFLKYKKNHPALFNGIKSWRLFKQEFGANAGMYIEIWEHNNWSDIEKNNKRIFKDKGMKTIQAAFHQLIDPTSFSSSVWQPIA